jgi:DNA-binding beta-propeller fold protein YncE
MSGTSDHDRAGLLATSLSRRELGGLSAGMLAAWGLGAETAAQPRKRKHPHQRHRRQRRRRESEGQPQPTFQFVTAWGEHGDDNGEFDEPRAVAFDGEGNNIYVADTNNHRIQKFTNDGIFLTAWGAKGSGNGEFNDPTGIAVGFSPEVTNDVFVTDSGNARIQRFSSAGAFRTAWGTPGTGNGQFGEPFGIVLDPDGNSYVVDVDLNRVQIFDANGAFIRAFGSEGPVPPFGELDDPTGVAIAFVGFSFNIYVADLENNRVQVFDFQGNQQFLWGSKGNGNGQFDDPWGVAVDKDTNVYVTDYNNHRVQVFTNNGDFITAFGTKGDGDGQFDHPTGIAIDPFTNTIYVADTDNHRIQVFAQTD